MHTIVSLSSTRVSSSVPRLDTMCSLAGHSGYKPFSYRSFNLVDCNYDEARPITHFKDRTIFKVKCLQICLKLNIEII